MENNIFKTGTTLEKIAEYGKLISDIATIIPVVPEQREELIERLHDHFAVLEDLISKINDEDLEVPLIVPEADEWSCDGSELERQEGK